VTTASHTSPPVDAGAECSIGPAAALSGIAPRIDAVLNGSHARAGPVSGLRSDYRGKS
jgi:hypothetical protein